MKRAPSRFSKTAIKRREAQLALKHAKKAMRAAGLSESDIDGFIKQVDANCAGPCKTATQAYGSLIWALTDALKEAEDEINALNAHE